MPGTLQVMAGLSPSLMLLHWTLEALHTYMEA